MANQPYSVQISPSATVLHRHGDKFPQKIKNQSDEMLSFYVVRGPGFSSEPSTGFVKPHAHKTIWIKYFDDGSREISDFRITFELQFVGWSFGGMYTLSFPFNKFTTVQIVKNCARAGPTTLLNSNADAAHALEPSSAVLPPRGNKRSRRLSKKQNSAAASALVAPNLEVECRGYPEEHKVPPGIIHDLVKIIKSNAEDADYRGYLRHTGQTDLLEKMDRISLKFPSESSLSTFPVPAPSQLQSANSVDIANRLLGNGVIADTLRTTLPAVHQELADFVLNEPSAAARP